MSQAIRETLKQKMEGAAAERQVEILFDFMLERGQSNYDESVKQIEHALQCAHLAASEGCSDEAVTAALFHDIGHLLLDEHHGQAAFLAEDLNHEEAGANLLDAWFPPEVTEPIRLHVPAKRYLCTVEAEYYDGLSIASQRSFEVQGGRLSAAEQSELEANAGLDIAVQLRRYDDRGKQADLETPPIETYAETVQRCLRTAPS